MKKQLNKEKGGKMEKRLQFKKGLGWLVVAALLLTMALVAQLGQSKGEKWKASECIITSRKGTILIRLGG